MSDLYSGTSGTSFDDSNLKPGDKEKVKELEEFLSIEQGKADMYNRVFEFNDICWEKCVDKPGKKLDGKTENCLNNCVDRFIDTSLLITTRYIQKAEKLTGNM